MAWYMYMSFLCVFITPNNLYSEPLTIDLKVALLCEEQVSRVTGDSCSTIGD